MIIEELMTKFGGRELQDTMKGSFNSGGSPGLSEEEQNMAKT